MWCTERKIHAYFPQEKSKTTGTGLATTRLVNFKLKRGPTDSATHALREALKRNIQTKVIQSYNGLRQTICVLHQHHRGHWNRCLLISQQNCFISPILSCFSVSTLREWHGRPYSSVLARIFRPKPQVSSHPILYIQLMHDYRYPYNMCSKSTDEKKKKRYEKRKTWVVLLLQY